MNNLIEEKYIFTRNVKRKIAFAAGAGLILLIIGLLLLMFGGHGDHNTAGEAGHGYSWMKRVWSNLWINNIYFAGISIIGVFFVAIQYVAQAGWSASIKRIPLAFGSWLPIAGVLMVLLFLVGYFGHIFHWSHAELYHEFLEDGVTKNPEYDAIIAGKSGYLNFSFYLIRTLLYFGLWYWMFNAIRRLSVREDLHGGVSYWYKMRKYSAIFLIIFGVTSSTSAWDWVLSVDTHWFSTMFGWYVFASWFVSGLAAITLIVVLLKENGYLKIVNANHLHDLGKFLFAFSIFWTYIWFSQFMLIYYANIPEETIYYVERLASDHYTGVFVINLIINFLFPFLVLMTRDSKRHAIFLKIVCIVILAGHWLDFYLMITPGILGEFGGIHFFEIGLALIYASGFAYTVLASLSKMPLIAKNHPMLQESIHHHI